MVGKPIQEIVEKRQDGGVLALEILDDQQKRLCDLAELTTD
jgi:hypothetical protein